MKQAQAFWRMCPRQIASDLRRFFRCHVRDWHRGDLSSYELLELFGASIVDDPHTGRVHPDTVVYVWSKGQLTRRLYASFCDGTRTIKVEVPPEGGAGDQAVREGGYTRLEHLVAESHNELARFRASYHTVSSRGKVTYEPPQMLDPRVEKAREAKKRELEEFQKQTEEALFGGLDW